VEIGVIAGHPYRVLTEAARRAQLVVLGDIREIGRLMIEEIIAAVARVGDKRRG